MAKTSLGSQNASLRAKMRALVAKMSLVAKIQAWVYLGWLKWPKCELRWLKQPKCELEGQNASLGSPNELRWPKYEHEWPKYKPRCIWGSQNVSLGGQNATLGGEEGEKRTIYLQLRFKCILIY